MDPTSTPDINVRDIEGQVIRLGNLLKVMVHLVPDRSEPFDYCDELLAVIFAAQDLNQHIHDQICASAAQAADGTQR